MFQNSIHQRQSKNKKIVGCYSYEEEDILGKGNQATVYKGINIENNIQVAIKVVNTAKFGSGIGRKLLESQMKVLQLLKGKPHVLDTIEIISSTDQIHIVTELCYGDISHRAGKKIQEGEAWKYLRQMIKGYKCLFDNKIIHRDLKPDNLFINAKGQIKIGDFGFALTSQQAKKQCHYNIGSPQYMAPQALKKNQYSYLSDIWAIGMIFFEMLTGLKPWKNRNQQHIQKSLNQQFIYRMLKKSNISPKANQFLSSALACDIQKRMTPQQLIIFEIQIQQITPLRSYKSQTITKFQGQLNLQPAKQRKKTIKRYEIPQMRKKSTKRVENGEFGKKSNKLLQHPQNRNNKRLQYNKIVGAYDFNKQSTQRKIYIKKQNIKTQMVSIKRNKSINIVDQIRNIQTGSISQNLMFKINICQGLFSILSKMRNNNHIKEFLKQKCFEQCNLIFRCYSNLIIKILQKIIDFQTNNFLYIAQPNLKKFFKSPQYGKIIKICQQLIKKYSKSDQLKQQWIKAKQQNVMQAINITKNFLDKLCKSVQSFNIEVMIIMKIIKAILPLLDCLFKNKIDKGKLQQFLLIINQKYNNKEQKQYVDFIEEVKNFLEKEK